MISGLVGDCFMVSFADPVAAVGYGMAVQEGLCDGAWPDVAAFHEVNDTGDGFLPDPRLGGTHRQAFSVTSPRWPESGRGNDILLDPGRQFPHYRNKWARRCDDMGKTIWNGIAVRVGIAYGDIKHEVNPVTQRVDYRGRTVNLASRCELAWVTSA
eukprot:gene13259-biopygen4824